MLEPYQLLLLIFFGIIFSILVTSTAIMAVKTVYTFVRRMNRIFKFKYKKAMRIRKYKAG